MIYNANTNPKKAGEKKKPNWEVKKKKKTGIASYINFRQSRLHNKEDHQG